jgi:hypothetical protein
MFPLCKFKLVRDAVTVPVAETISGGVAATHRLPWGIISIHSRSKVDTDGTWTLVSGPDACAREKQSEKGGSAEKYAEAAYWGLGLPNSNGVP